MIRFLLFATLLVTLLGCHKESTVNSVLPVNQTYNLYYNVTTNETKTKASFYNQDNKTILPSGYSITVNDSGMTMFQNPGPPPTPSTGPTYYYERNFTGLCNAHFKLRTADGTILNNFIASNTVDLITFDSITAPVSKSDTLIVHINTDSLNPGEAVSINIIQDIYHFTYQNVTYNSGDTVLMLLPNHMNILLTGPAHIQVSRQSPVLQLTDPDGTGTGEMHAMVYATQDITIVQ